jgi:hypothetical protein
LEKSVSTNRKCLHWDGSGIKLTFAGEISELPFRNSPRICWEHFQINIAVTFELVQRFHTPQLLIHQSLLSYKAQVTTKPIHAIFQ